MRGFRKFHEAIMIKTVTTNSLVLALLASACVSTEDPTDIRSEGKEDNTAVPQDMCQHPEVLGTAFPALRECLVQAEIVGCDTVTGQEAPDQCSMQEQDIEVERSVNRAECMVEYAIRLWAIATNLGEGVPKETVADYLAQVEPGGKTMKRYLKRNPTRDMCDYREKLAKDQGLGTPDRAECDALVLAMQPQDGADAHLQAQKEQEEEAASVGERIAQYAMATALPPAAAIVPGNCHPIVDENRCSTEQSQYIAICMTDEADQTGCEEQAAIIYDEHCDYTPTHCNGNNVAQRSCTAEFSACAFGVVGNNLSDWTHMLKDRIQSACEAAYNDCVKQVVLEEKALYLCPSPMDAFERYRDAWISGGR